jgi:hypothetical protein
MNFKFKANRNCSKVEELLKGLTVSEAKNYFIACDIEETKIV